MFSQEPRKASHGRFESGPWSPSCRVSGSGRVARRAAPRKSHSRKGELRFRGGTARLALGCGTAGTVDAWSVRTAQGAPMAKLDISQNTDGLWTVSTAGLIVTDLSREEADAFVETYERCLAGLDASAL